jgi:voltage-gated potassium channel Kch
MYFCSAYSLAFIIRVVFAKIFFSIKVNDSVIFARTLSLSLLSGNRPHKLLKFLLKLSIVLSLRIAESSLET